MTDNKARRYPPLEAVDTFLDLSRTLSVTRTALNKGVSQPTVSMHLAKLEHDLGSLLFDRTNRGLILTEYGRALIPDAVDMLGLAAAMMAGDAAPLDGPAALRIGAIEPMGSHYLPPFLGRYQSLVSGPITFELQGGTTSSLTLGVREGRLDFALVARPPRLGALTFRPLRQEPIALLVPRAHAYARESNVSIRKLADQRLILTDDACDFRIMLQREFDRQHLAPDRVTTISSIDGIIDAVREQLGLAILPLCSVTPPPKKTAVVAIEHSRLHLKVGICARQRLRGSAARSAMTFVAETLHRPGA